MEKGVLLSSEVYHNGTEGINASYFKDFVDVLHKLKKEDFEKFLLGEFSFVIKNLQAKKKSGFDYERFVVGEIIHSICLENKTFDTVISTCDFRGVSKDSFIKKFQKMIGYCEVSWRRYEFFSRVGAEYRIENVYFGSYLDMKLKSKVDFVGVLDGVMSIVDLKTVASEDSIDKNIDTYHYWFQLLFYNHVLNNECKELVLLFICKDSGLIRERKFSELSMSDRSRLLNLFLIYMEYFYQYWLQFEHVL